MRTGFAAYRDTSLLKLTLIIAAVIALLSVTYLLTESDTGSATQVDGKTYFYDQLEAHQKAILDGYDDFDVICEDDMYKVSFSVPIHSSLIGRSVAEVQSAYGEATRDSVLHTLLWEHPTDYWLGTGLTLGLSYYSSGDTVTSGTVTVKITNCVWTYGNTKSDLLTKRAEITTLIDSVVLNDTSTRFSTIRSINKYVCDTLTYDNDTPEGMGCRNTYTALIGTHKVVCEGYARTFKAFCDKWDIPCILVTGDGDVGTPPATELGPHMWNYVQMENDQWYLVDSTWNDQTIMVETYLVVGGNSDGFHKKISSDHIVSDSAYTVLTLPSLNAEAYSSNTFTFTFYNFDGSVYNRQENLVFDSDFNTKPADPTYTDTNLANSFVFNHWDPGVPAKVTANMEFHAVYDVDYKDYTITFKDWDDAILSTKTDYHYYQTVVKPADPSRAMTDYKVYTFRWWAVEGEVTQANITTVQGSVTYKAIYLEEDRHYTITFIDADGTVLSTKNDYLFDQAVTVPSPDHIVDFEWDAAVSATVTGDATYTAVKSTYNDGGHYTYKFSGDSVVFSATDLSTAKSTSKPLTIVIGVGSVTFDNTAKQALLPDKTISIKLKSFGDLRNSVQRALGNAVVYGIDFGANNEQFSAGKATVSFNFTPREGQDPSDLKLYYVDGDQLVETENTYADGKVTFTTNHFSTYAIQIPTPTPDIVQLLMDNIILIGILLFAIIGMALSYRFG